MPQPLRSANWREVNGFDFSVSPDGDLVAFALPDRPVNEIAIIDLKRRTAWTLRHDDPLVMLSEPTFMPTGALCLVVKPPTYGSVSEFWFTDHNGKPADVYGADGPALLHRKPSFSADGSRLLCMREIEMPEVPIQREYRSLLYTSFYEIDLIKRTATRVTDKVFNPFGRVYYAAQPGMLLVNCLAPLVPMGRIPGHWTYQSQTKIQDLDGPFRAFVFNRREPFPTEPTPIVPPELFGEKQPLSVALADVDSSGRPLIEYWSTPAPDGWDPSIGFWKRAFFEGGQLRDVPALTGQAPRQVAVAARGDCAVTIVQARTGDRTSSIAFDPKNLALSIWRAPQSASTLSYSEIAWTGRSIAVRPAQKSRLAL